MDLSRVPKEEIFDPSAEDEERGANDGAQNNAQERVVSQARMIGKEFIHRVHYTLFFAGSGQAIFRSF